MSTVQPSRTHRVRHALLTASLVLGPVLIAISSAMALDLDWEDRAEVIATATSQPGAWQAQQLIAMAGFMLLVPAAIAAGELVRRRHPLLALTGVILLASGAMVIVGAIIQEFTLAAAAGVDAEAIAQYDAQIDELSGVVVLFPFFFAALLGLLVLAVGLWRSRTVPRWAPVLLAVSIVVTFFAGPGVVSLLSEVGLTAGFLGVAWAHWTRRERTEVLVLPEPATTMDATAAANGEPPRDERSTVAAEDARDEASGSSTRV